MVTKAHCAKLFFLWKPNNYCRQFIVHELVINIRDEITMMGTLSKELPSVWENGFIWAWIHELLKLFRSNPTSLRCHLNTFRIYLRHSRLTKVSAFLEPLQVLLYLPFRSTLQVNSWPLLRSPYLNHPSKLIIAWLLAKKLCLLPNHSFLASTVESFSYISSVFWMCVPDHLHFLNTSFIGRGQNIDSYLSPQSTIW